MKPVTQINFIAIKPEKVEEFFELDQSYRATAQLPKGLVGSRLYRSLDGRTVVRVTEYESAEAHKETHENEALLQQINKLRPLVESSTSGLYEEANTTGNVK